MADQRYVLLGLARARSPWFASLLSWATEAIAPIDFIKCLTADEVRVRLDGDRRFSALFVDAATSGADRDLFEQCAAHRCAVIVVGQPENAARWIDLGAAAIVPSGFDRRQLLDVLEDWCTPIDRVPDTDRRPPPPPGAANAEAHELDAGLEAGRVAALVAVTGSGGTGASTVAAALAQGWADNPKAGGRVALADLALRADQGMLHNVGDVVPGVQELVDAFRLGRPRADQVRSQLFSIVDRRYDLLLGLRRSRDWTALRPAATAAAIDGLRRAYDVVIADIDADVEDEASTGSVDIEDRNLLSRTAIAAADLTVVVAQPGVWGVHNLVRTLHNLLDGPLDPTRVLVVVNDAPRRARDRAEISGAIAALLLGTAADGLPGPVYLRSRQLEPILRSGGRLPASLTRPVLAAVRAQLAGLEPDPLGRLQVGEPVAIRPGELGRFATSTDVPPESHR